MYMKDEKIVEIDDYRLELENRIRNLLWTISGDYTLNMKVDVSLYLRSKAIALYDGIKQGALAKYYDRNLLGLYLVKKVFCQAGEGELTAATVAACTKIIFIFISHNFLPGFSTFIIFTFLDIRFK